MNTRTSFLARLPLPSGFARALALAGMLAAAPCALGAGGATDAPAAEARAGSAPLAAVDAATRVLPADRAPALSGLRSESVPGGLRSGAESAEGSADPTAGFLQELIDAGRDEPEFLHPDAAFRMEASARNPGLAIVRWSIEPDYYLYAERVEVHLPEGSPPGTSIAGLDLPAGETEEDPYFGRVEVYRFEAMASVRLAHSGSPPSALALDVVYQGCADAGLCYPPIRKVVAVRLDGAGPGSPPGGSSAPAGIPSASLPDFSAGSPPAGAALSETDRIAWRLATGGLGASAAAFFGFGVLLSLTPCIFPMIPILSSILVAGGAGGAGGTTGGAGRTGGAGGGAPRGRKRGLALSLAYVSGSALAWAVIGGVAGLLGANVQIALQSPWAIGAVSVAFVALALSMFGLYSFELPSGWMTRATGWTNRAGRSGGYAGAAAMGVVSALVVGPCVAAPMAGAVLYIGQAGDAVRGSLALAAMGYGMGVPLLVLGASSSRLLPRAGPWMDTLQRAAGVVLLGVAAYLLERVLPSAAALAAWAVVAASACAVLAWAAWKPRRRGARYAVGAGALAAAVYAAVLVVGASTGARDPLHPLAGLRSPMAPGAGPGAGPGALEFTAIKGLDGPRGLEAALARAEAEGRFVMLDFYADWCVSCKELEESTFRDPGVLAALGGVRVLRADVTAYDAADQALMKRLGVLGPPAILFFGPDREERRRYRTVGFKDAADFTRRVSGATSAA